MMKLFKFHFLFSFCVFYYWIPLINATAILSLISSDGGDFCITNSSSAMYFKNTTDLITEETKPFLYDYRHTPELRLYGISWKSKYASELNYENLPVLDASWESFPVRKLGEWNKKNRRMFFAPLNVVFKAATAPNIQNSPCYWFILQGWSGTKSVIRKCDHGQIGLRYNQYPLSPCSSAVMEINHPENYPLFMDRMKWTHLIFEKIDRTFFLKRFTNGRTETILKYTDTGEEYDINFMFGLTKDMDEGFYKIHDYSYYTTESLTMEKIMYPYTLYGYNANNEFCLSFFWTSCKTCFMNVHVTDKSDSIYIEKIPPSNETWGFRKISFKLLNQNLDLNVVFESYKYSNSDENFWALRNIRACSPEEYRVSRYYPKNQLQSCHLLDDDSDIMRQDNNEYSPELSRGSHLSCEILQRSHMTNTCQRIRTCEIINNKSLCFCFPGYTGNDCEKTCKSGKYGYDCREECGHCRNAESCNPENGRCKTCNEFFNGTYCKIPLYDLILKNPPTITSSSANTCFLQLSAMEYYGKGIPKYYIVQYKADKSSSWIDYGNAKKIKENRIIQIKNLEFDTKYSIRILISEDKDDVKKLENGDVPYSLCSTLCKEWDKNDFDVSVTNTTVSLIFKESKGICMGETFRWRCQGGKSETNGVGNIREEVRQINLTPFTNYTITLNDQINNNIEVQTLVGVPSEIGEIIIEQNTTTTIQLMWKEPENPNGVITHYKILYNRKHGKACDKKPVFKQYESLSNINRITLTDLTPYSDYLVIIHAVNERFQSAGKIIQVETLGVEKFYNIEDIDEIEVTPTEISSKFITFQTKNLNCDKRLGEIKMRMEVSCGTEWCSNSTSHIMNRTSFNYSKLINLYPFTDYKCSISFCRGNFCILRKNLNLTTKASPPNEIRDFKIISLGKNFVYMRWLPPYPPTGTLEQYRLIFQCKNDCPMSKIEFRPKKCKLWPQYDCYKFESSLYYNHQIRIKIEAAIQELSGFNNASKLYDVSVTEKASEPIYGSKIRWTKANEICLSWNHPNVTNGDLVAFEIGVKYNDHKISENFTIGLDEYKFEYNYTIQQRIPPAEDVKIDIIAINSYRSQPIEIEGSSYPVVPRLSNSNIQITTVRNNEISIFLNLWKLEGNSTVDEELLFILIEDFDVVKEKKDRNLIDLAKKFNESFDDYLRVVGGWNLKKFEQKFLNFTIGNRFADIDRSLFNYTIVNEPLKEGHPYRIDVLLVNGYKGKYRMEKYFIDASIESESHNNSIIWIIIIILLLLIFSSLIFALIKKRKLLIKSRNIPEIVIRGARSRNETKSLVSADYVEVNYSPSSFIRQNRKNRPKPPPTEFDPNTYLKSRRVSCMSKEYYEIVTYSCVSAEYIEILNEHVSKTEDRKSESSAQISKNLANIYEEIHTKLVKTADFEEYVKEAITKGLLDEQFNSIAVEQADSASRFNVDKGVILRIPSKDQSPSTSDLIYINGYNLEKTYIATKNPEKGSFIEFWEKIWANNVQYVVMLDNVDKNGKKEIVQYWPKENQELRFGKISVICESIRSFSDFECRTFNISRHNENREFEQLHFTSWPAHSVPLYSQTLVPFLLKILKIPLLPSSPVIFHCRDGFGRIGTILLSDICLRMAAKEKALDMWSTLKRLKAQLPEIVENVEQYKLAHLIVFECLRGFRTGIPCNKNMEESVQRLINEWLYAVQMDYLEDTDWQKYLMICETDGYEKSTNHSNKNRIQEIAPALQEGILLKEYPTQDHSSSYINAIQVDGFKCPEKYIVTQQPMPNTLGDFWRMIVEKKTHIVISLNDINPNDQTCCEFWPTEKKPELNPVDFIRVTFNNVISSENHEIFCVKVSVYREESQDVNIIFFKGWRPRSYLPQNIGNFVDFLEGTETISRNFQNVIVTCFDGAKASGVFVALSFVIEKMRLDHECDVCLAVRTVRHNRTQFVRDESQFIFLYEAALLYTKKYMTITS